MGGSYTVELIGLVKYGGGNYASVRNALDYLGCNVVEVENPDQLGHVGRIILPGVGAFGAMLQKLHSIGLGDAIRDEVLDSGKIFLGICVGMQILASVGTEFEEVEGLGLIPGRILRIQPEGQHLPVPQIGWNEVTLHRESKLFRDIEEDASFYFVHSYHFVPGSRDHLVGTCEYGGQVTACVERENIYGVQFHPEKSQLNGLQLLRNFAEMGT
jgi:imidazole glycerol-phosphate synthase subunit HisH